MRGLVPHRLKPAATIREMKKIISVPIGEFRVSTAPNILITHNLGSCVGVVLYDIFSKIGGLAHISLPDSKSMAKENNNPKFADIAISSMIGKIENMGAIHIYIIAKIAGGGNMFNLKDLPLEMDVGAQNVLAVRKYLAREGIRIIADDTLGYHPRTMEFNLTTGKVTLKTKTKGEKYL